MAIKPKPPLRKEPREREHYPLWSRVCEAIRALPMHFRSETVIGGILATDIFTLNSALGATIEEQVVAALNALRPVWDPDKKYQTFGFVRQTQAFPDVLLRKQLNGHEILLGIELKGWYMLAKEGEPSFRFVANAAACADRDLIVVVPWVLSNVLAGSPVAYDVFIDLANYTAQQRNHYWQYERDVKEGNKDINLATGATVYPAKSDKISDKAVYDPGGNFGRLARYGIMEQFVKKTMETPLRGIPASQWLSFFRNAAKAAKKLQTAEPVHPAP